MGELCRARYLREVEDMCKKNKKLPSGLAIADMLRHMVSGPTVENYFTLMRAPLWSRRQCGSYAEASVLVAIWKVQIGFFGQTETGVVLLQEPLGYDKGSYISVLWSGGHYDLLILDTDQWLHAQQFLPDGTGAASTSLPESRVHT